MFNSYLVEIDETPMGVLTRTGLAFKFHAVDRSCVDLHGSTFPDAAAAERAVQRLRQRRKRGLVRA